MQLSRVKLICAAMAVCACVFGVAVHAADVAGLYEAAVDTSTDKARDSAFVEAFRMVSVKVSGIRSAADKFSSDIPNIRNNVQLRAVRPDGAVTIRFDSAWVDHMLTAANLPIWGRERPTVLIWLSVPDASGKPVWVTSEQSGPVAPERDAIERVAAARGLPIIWPAMDAADLATVGTLVGAARGSSQALSASGERYRADAVLLGVGNRDAAGGVTVRWSFALPGDDEGPLGETQTSVDEGVQQAADRCARLFAVAAGAHSDVSVSISGIHTFDAYAGAMSYLQGLTVVLGISVDQLSADTLRLRVAVRGDAGTLRHAAELKRRGAALVVDSTVALGSAVGAASGDNSLKFRSLQ